MYKHRKHTIKKYKSIKSKKNKRNKTRFLPKNKNRVSNHKYKFYQGGSYSIKPEYTPYNDGGTLNDINTNLNKTMIQSTTNASTDQ